MDLLGPVVGLLLDLLGSVWIYWDLLFYLFFGAVGIYLDLLRSVWICWDLVGSDVGSLVGLDLLGSVCIFWDPFGSAVGSVVGPVGICCWIRFLDLCRSARICLDLVGAAWICC